jgi:hypothetical protein
LPQTAKSREETPKEGIGGKRLAAPQQYARAVHKKQEGLSVFFGKLDRTLGPCFYFIFEETGRSLRKNGSGQSGRCGGAALN